MTLAPHVTRRPEFLTFTGVDDCTSLVDMISLSKRYPIEWGVLFSPKREGNRYPTTPINTNLAQAHNLRMVAHLCGGYARRVAAYADAAIIDLDFVPFQRVQFNGQIAATNCRLWAQLNGMKPILQTRSYNFPTLTSVTWLYDQSGGRGKLAQRWPHHEDERLVGYAGGLEASNIMEVIEAIDPIGLYYMDMEGRLRDADDWFDLNRCEAVCKRVYG